MKSLIRKIHELKRKRDALILAHNYQRPEVQDIADATGDSLELGLIAAKSQKKTIVFCGVRFMAETAAILSPQKTILLPVSHAGCGLADSITANDVRRLKKKHPQSLIMAYVNTTCEVKAECDLCCTSGNAVPLRKSLGRKSVVFVPDKNLGAYLGGQTSGKTICWNGFCPVHELLSADDILKMKRQYPRAKLMAHPECRPAVLRQADYVGGTAGMLRFVSQESAGKTFLVATESGLIHRLKKENPGKIFYPVSPFLVCPTMKLITLASVWDALEKMQYRVCIPDGMHAKARKALAHFM